MTSTAALAVAPLVAMLALTGCNGDDGDAAATAETPAAASSATEAAVRSSEAEPASDAESGPAAHYPLEEGYQSSLDGAPALQVVGDVELVPDDDSGTAAAAFGSNSGLALDTSDLITDPTVYTVAFRFYLDTQSSRPEAWFKLVDFNDRRSDAGFYAHKNSLQFYHYPTHAGRAPLGGGPYATVVLRRDADEQISWFVDGVHQATVNDSEPDYGSTRYGTIEEDILHFFLDDTPSNELEQSPGRVAWLTIYDRALDNDTIATL